MEEFKKFNKTSFPLAFSYPASAKYIERTKRKYLSAIALREGKEKYQRMTPEEIEKYRRENIGAGTLKWVFPKLSISHFKQYVPASQSHTKTAYFMHLDEYLRIIEWKRRTIYPNAIFERVSIGFGEGEMVTFMHEADDFFRSDVVVADKDDAETLLRLLYRHTHGQYSFEEMYKIMETIEKQE